MTFWAKLLTIIILVLSIAFAAASGIIFTKRQDLRGQLNTEKQKAAQTQAALSKTISEREQTIDGMKQQIDADQKTLDARQREIDALTAQNASKDGRILDLSKKLDARDSQIGTLAATTKQLSEQYSAVSKENDGMRKEAAELRTKLSDEQKRANDLAAKNAGLQNNLDSTKTSLAEATGTLKLNEEVFAELAKNNIEARPIIEGLTAMPDIKAKVAWVDEEAKMVTINAGKSQGVRKNYYFTVFRGDKYVARVNIFYVSDMEEYSTGRIINQEQPVQLGDNAWTRLP